MQGGPGDPTNLAAHVTGNTVRLLWLAPVSPPAAITGYVLQAGVTPETTFATVPVGTS
jgi:hypothetical protein